MHPSNVRPDLSLLKLIKESEIERGHVIGSGAFGTVYEVRFAALFTSLAGPGSLALLLLTVTLNWLLQAVIYCSCLLFFFSGVPRDRMLPCR